MEKVKIEFEKINNKIIRFNNSKIEVKPYLSAMDILVANDMCLDQFFEHIDNPNSDKFDLFPQVRLMFDLVVLQQCTNVDTDGIDVDRLCDSKIMSIIRKHIYNYNNAWDSILEAIRLKNVSVALSQVAETLPSQAEMEKSIKAMGDFVQDLDKRDPQLLTKMVQTAALNVGMDEAKEEFKIEVVERKAETLKKVANKSTLSAKKKNAAKK